MPTTRYTHAVVCRLPRSLMDAQPTLDYDRAKRQHENYVRVLRDIGLDVIEMPADEETPWCAFVDDTAFVCNGTAIITKPAEPERAKEVRVRVTIIISHFLPFHYTPTPRNIIYVTR